MARVLIIEDSPSQAALIQEIVQSAGHEALVCTSLGKGVAQTVKPLNPEIVLLDLVLLGPDGKQQVDGYQVCREIKRVLGSHIGIIIISARADEDSAEWAILQGADGFLEKPFAVPDLLEVMNDVLGTKGKKAEA